MSVLETHILRAFRDNPKVRPKNLCERFKSPRNTISQALTRLEKRKFLKRSKSTHGDKRATSFELTPSGSKVLAEAFNSGSKLVSGPASSLTDSELSTLVSIIQILATGYSLVTDKNSSRDVHFSDLTTEEERGRARSFLMDYLLRTDQADSAPATLIGKKDIAHALIQDDHILALLVYHPVNRAYELSMAATSLLTAPESDVLGSFSRFSIGELASSGRKLLNSRRMPLPSAFKGVFETLTRN